MGNSYENVEQNAVLFGQNRRFALRFLSLLVRVGSWILTHTPVPGNF